MSDRPRRTVVPGLIPPGQTIVLRIDPPLVTGEHPVVLSANAGGVLMKTMEHDHVSVENLTDAPMVVLLLVVPTFLVKAASTDWTRILAEVRNTFSTPESGIAALRSAASRLLYHLTQRKPPTP
jgi:hypothetical protein